MTAKKAAKKTAKNKQTVEPKRLLLLDTHAIIHRAYHALPDLSSSKGEPTGALFGLMTMLLKSIADLKPDYIVAARDRAEKTHRHEVYEDYKATRAKTEDALVAQLKRAKEVFDAFGIPVLDSNGYEADDVVGTVARQMQKRPDVMTVILTGDMDMLQLVVDGQVTVYRLLTGISNMKFYDEEAVRERYGFGPEHIADYKGMCGDPSDNIKGIKGIGDKTATDLIQAFGSIEDIYATLKKNPALFEQKGFKSRIVALLKDGEKDARTSKELATIRTDAPVEFELPEHTWRIEDHADRIRALCDVFEFRSLKSKLPEALSESASESEAAAAGVDPFVLAETSVALWLLRSELTNPDLTDILTYANARDFEAARDKIFSELKNTGRLWDVWERIEKPLVPIVRKMTETGIAVDVAYLTELSKEYAKGLGELEKRIYRHAGHEFNINSPKQLGDVLFDELKIGEGKLKKTATGARTTREEELSKMADSHPIIGDILAYRELQKLLSTYIDKIPGLVADDGRLHAYFLQAGAATGRMASERPNLQNIPIRTEYGKRIRNAFIAAPGYKLAAIDYSQIELRIAAGLSGDEKLVGIFQRGEDVHSATAAQVFGVASDQVDREMRRRAKVINFGILYGMGVNALRQNLGSGVSRDEAAKFLESYFNNFTGLARYIEETKTQAAKLGYTETLFGRRRYFPGFKSPLPGLRAQAERMAVNAPMQGTQSDIIKRAMVEADEYILQRGWENKARLLLQVHDELVYEVDEKDAESIAKKLRDIMEGVVSPEQLSGVPIIAEVSLGHNWGNVTKIQR